jgi:hypothetical protein
MTEEYTPPPRFYVFYNNGISNKEVEFDYKVQKGEIMYEGFPVLDHVKEDFSNE